MSDTALKVSRSLYCFTTSICHGVENYFPKLWGTGRLLAGYKARCWSWSFTRSRTSTASFYRTPPLIGCLDTATAPNIDLGV